MDLVINFHHNFFAFYSSLFVDWNVILSNADVYRRYLWHKNNWITPILLFFCYFHPLSVIDEAQINEKKVYLPHETIPPTNHRSFSPGYGQSNGPPLSPWHASFPPIVQRVCLLKAVTTGNNQRQTFGIAGTDHSIGNIQHFEPFIA